MAYTVALIGAGNMGQRHAQHWAAMPDVEIVGVLSKHPDSARALAARVAPCGAAAAYADFETLLAQAGPDIVDICTPTPAHPEYIERAAAAGKAIFVEKPLARTLAAAEAARTVVERTGVPLMVGHVLRYFPEYAAARRLVGAGAVGKPAAIRAARLSGLPGSGRPHNWYADPAQSGGVVLDLSIHDFDWLRWTFGPVTRVFAKGLPDYALVTLRFASDAVAHVTGSWAHPDGFRTTFEIAGDAGLIEHDSALSAPLSLALRAPDSGRDGGVAVPESPMAPAQDPYYLELRAFVDALREGTPPPVTIQDAWEALRIALAALESIETGKVMRLA